MQRLADFAIPASERLGSVTLNWSSGELWGPPVQESIKTVKDLKGVFRDDAAWQALKPQREIYRVRWWAPVAAGDEGGLFWGVTILQPGKVGDEYFMTHGHFHANRTRAEYYATVAGTGTLLHMDADRRTWAEEMIPGRLHYIRGEHAHRAVNVGDEPLIFWACWGSDAGYDYGTIQQHGFSASVIERNGKPAIVPHES
jgi:glucose-6-phosphate isomerase, archaeal